MQIQSFYASNAGSSAVAATAAASSAAGTAPIAVDRRGEGRHRDGEHEGHHDHGRGGGRLHQALAEALKSLGLSLPQPGAAPAPAPAPAQTDATPAVAATDVAATTDATATTDTPATTPAPVSDNPTPTADLRQTLRQDVHDFMHQLFSALRDSAGGGTDTGEGGEVEHPSRHELRDHFSEAMSTLIGQVGSGNAPAGLQSAFDKLVTDLKSFGSSTTQSSAPGGTGSTPPSAPSLQQLLSALQQQTGYGRNPGCGSVGNTVNVTA